MGAYGSALIAYDQWLDLTAPKPGEPEGTVHEVHSTIAKLDELESLRFRLSLNAVENVRIIVFLLLIRSLQETKTEPL